MPIALLSASARNGNYISDENFEEVDIYEPVPEKASFGVYLDGDSMEPEFQNGDLIWIEKTEYLNSGEIGLFYLDGNTYFKKFVQKETGTFLVSINAKYKSIPITNFDGCNDILWKNSAGFSAPSGNKSCLSGNFWGKKRCIVVPGQ